jgi:DNA-directed RNA polymerase subunit RPC12/RpoP
MNCKYCNSESVVKNGRVKGEQVYKCKSCGHRFTEGSAFPKMRTKSRIISSSIDFYFEGLSIRKISTQIEKLYGVHVSNVSIWSGYEYSTWFLSMLKRYRLICWEFIMWMKLQSSVGRSKVVLGLIDDQTNS